MTPDAVEALQRSARDLREAAARLEDEAEMAEWCALTADAMTSWLAGELEELSARDGTRPVRAGRLAARPLRACGADSAPGGLVRPLEGQEVDPGHEEDEADGDDGRVHTV
jgi:hypothetical protein